MSDSWSYYNAMRAVEVAAVEELDGTDTFTIVFGPEDELTAPLIRNELELVLSRPAILELLDRIVVCLTETLGAAAADIGLDTPDGTIIRFPGGRDE